MSKIVQLLFVFFFLQMTVVAQTNLRGRIQDKETKKTLPGAYVFIKTTEGDTLAKTFTYEKGRFELIKPQGMYFFRVVPFFNRPFYKA